MKQNFLQGIGFGITSGVITTLGLLVGLTSGTNEKLVVIGGVSVIAIADALSDAFGVHVSTEARSNKNKKSLWQIPLYTFLSKFIVGISFIVPLLIFSLNVAVIISIIWAILLLSFFSYVIAKRSKENAIKAIIEHILIGMFVVFVSYYIGIFVNFYFS